ncbi:hypothetical protein G9A89_010031 [Geosiphon pyriformis]|nr:hypothetical protein G9A89_010031 [Geosiphon pyriformis]
MSNALKKLQKNKKLSKTPNAFFAYRMAVYREFSPTLKERYKMRELSRLAGKLWIKEPAYVKAKYYDLMLEARRQFEKICVETLQLQAEEHDKLKNRKSAIKKDSNFASYDQFHHVWSAAFQAPVSLDDLSQQTVDICAEDSFGPLSDKYCKTEVSTTNEETLFQKSNLRVPISSNHIYPISSPSNHCNSSQHNYPSVASNEFPIECEALMLTTPMLAIQNFSSFELVENQLLAQQNLPGNSILFPSEAAHLNYHPIWEEYPNYAIPISYSESQNLEEYIYNNRSLGNQILQLASHSGNLLDELQKQFLLLPSRPIETLPV